jgi:hypothetical protein
MKTKLTLSIDKKTVSKARKLSIRTKKSLSKLFEEYVEREMPEKTSTPLTDKLTGIIKGKVSKLTYKGLRATMYTDKHGA